MKEPEHNTVSKNDPGKKQKRRKGGTSFNNSKQKRRRELKKKEESCIERRGTPSELQNTSGEGKRGFLNQQLNLKSIEEKREDSDSQAASMAESEYPNNSNQSGSRFRYMDLCQWTGKISKYDRHLERDNEEDYVEWHFKNRKEYLVENLKGGH